MGNAGKVSISVEAQVEQASRALNKVRAETNAMAEAVGKLGVSQRDAKQVMGTLTASLGAQGHAVAEIGKSILEMGPIIGGVVAAVHIYNAATAEAAERTKLLEETAKKYAETMKVIGEMQGKIQPDMGLFSKKAEEQIKSTQAEIDKLVKGMKDATNSPLALVFGQKDIKADQAQLDKYREAQLALNKIKLATDAASAAQKKYNAEMMQISMGTKAGSENQIEQQMQATRDLLQTLNTEKSKVSGTEFTAMQDAWNEGYVKLIALQTSLGDAAKKVASEVAALNLKAFEEQNAAIGKLNEEMTKRKQDSNLESFEEQQANIGRIKQQQTDANKKAADALRQSVMSPMEQIDAKIKEIQNNPLIDPELQEKALRQMSDGIGEQIKALSPKGAVYSQSFDTSLINVDSLANASGMRDSTNDNTAKLVRLQEEQNVILKAIANKKAGPAYASD